MSNKILYGEQMTALVHALAGKKHRQMGSIERYLAEKIGYSQSTVRKMREGGAGQPAIATLEILAQTGCREAGLDREWARRFLQAGGDPQPEAFLDRLFDEEPPVLIIELPQPVSSPLAMFSRRFVFSALGALLMLALWSYGIYPVYPPPHELALPLELLWGLLVGLGIAAGLAAADGLRQPFSGWVRYLLLAAGGILGGLIWSLVRGLFPAGAVETLGYGLSYAGGLVGSVGVLWLRQSGPSWPARRWLRLAGAILLAGFSALLAYLLFSAQPSFSDQKNIDMAVGLALRLGLALALSITFPPPGPD